MSHQLFGGRHIAKGMAQLLATSRLLDFSGIEPLLNGGFMNKLYSLPVLVTAARA